VILLTTLLTLLTGRDLTVFLFTYSTLDGLGDFNIGGQIMQTVKYADDLVLMAKEEMVLQGLTDKVSEIGRYYGMEINVEKTKLMRMRVGGSVKTQLSQDRIYWLDDDDMFQPCLAIFRS
jgi:hypothetical protein